jgi:hypothetical protein
MHHDTFSQSECHLDQQKAVHYFQLIGLKYKCIELIDELMS